MHETVPGRILSSRTGVSGNIPAERVFPSPRPLSRRRDAPCVEPFGWISKFSSKNPCCRSPSATSGLVDSLTAVASKTTFGVQVVATWTETNVSNQDISVDNGPSIDGFRATEGGKVVWVSNGGINPDIIQLDVLKPHQSLTLSATWDGHLTVNGPLGQQEEGPALSGDLHSLERTGPRGPRPASVTIPKSWTAGPKVTPRRVAKAPPLSNRR